MLGTRLTSRAANERAMAATKQPSPLWAMLRSATCASSKAS